MKTFKLLSLILFFIVTIASAKDCKIANVDQQSLLKLSYQEFDQTMGNGWRKIGEQNHCYLEAADLIDNYLDRHKIDLLDWQTQVLTWHSGQMYGFTGNNKLARSRFLASVNPNETPNTTLLWNDYVHASVAFLDQDIKKLNYYRKKIAKGPHLENGKIANLEIVDQLIKCFKKPYALAYSGCN